MAVGKKTGGRKRGVPNKATSQIRALFQKDAPVLATELVRLATKAKSEQARVAAIKEAFDRGYGKSVQSITGELTISHEQALKELE